MTDKKTALITGAYGGLGRCFVDIHAKKGGNLILVGRDKSKLDEQKNEIEKKYNVAVQTIAGDFSQPQPRLAQEIYDTCKRNRWMVDYIINNAGFGGQGDFTRESKIEQDMSMIAVNVEMSTYLCKLFLPDFVKRGSGRVLNVSSTAAVMAGPLQACYYATKAYMTSFSNVLWRELKGTGVIVTCLMPGAMKTGFAKAGGLDNTKLFSNAVDPVKVAQDGYNGMLKGKLSVTSGLLGWQKLMMSFVPLSPKKAMLDFVYNQQLTDSTRNMK